MEEFVVYLLYSVTSDKIYIGYTSNLIARFHSHNKFATKGYTVKFRPWEVAYLEVFQTKKDAMRREKELKSSQGRMFLKTVLQNSEFISVS
jgi:putative endonuclease